MTKRLYFEEVNSVSDFVTLLVNDEENIDYIFNQGVDNETIEKYINAINKIAKTDEEKNFVKFVHYVDKKMNFAGEHNQNRKNKIPTIYSYANLLANYNDQFKKYNKAQKMIIANQQYYGDEKEWDNLSYNYPIELMDTITSIYPRYLDQLQCLAFSYFNKDKMLLETMINFIKNNDIKDIIECNRIDMNKLYAKIEGKDESRRI